jgi:hypothetical protein
MPQPPSDADAQAPPPQQVLLRLLAGAWAAQAVHAAAKLGIADLLAGGPRSAAELAEATGTHARRSIGCCGRWRAWVCSPRRGTAASA